MVESDMGLYASCEEHVNHVVVEVHAQLVDLQWVPGFTESAATFATCFHGQPSFRKYTQRPKILGVYGVQGEGCSHQTLRTSLLSMAEVEENGLIWQYRSLGTRIANADAGRVYLACSIGEHAAPGDGHPEHLDADRLRGGNVPGEAVVEVVSNRACISVEYLACSMFQTRGVLQGSF